MTFLLAVIAVVLACLSLGVYARNVGVYRRPHGKGLEPVSVLVPARDEESSVGPLLESLLEDPGCEIEVVVLDDHSSDETAGVVREWIGRDERVRLVSGKPLPPGWCGKQFACHQLSAAATHRLRLFLDADVRLSPGAVGRAAAELRRRRLDLLSGVPRQEFGGVLDRLLIPLIHFVLLGYLPLRRANRFLSPSYAAGCGQFFLTDAAAYEAAGGHAAIRESMHDGLKLPAAYRRAGLRTGLCDLTAEASCRMYDHDSEVWPGLSKNAVEGIAAPSRIGVFTVLLFGGHVLPWILLPWQPVLASAACGASLLPRLDAALRFRQPVAAALAHPLAVSLFLVMQWAALVAYLSGRRPRWKGRSVESDGSPVETIDDTLLSATSKPRSEVRG